MVKRVKSKEDKDNKNLLKEEKKKSKSISQRDKTKIEKHDLYVEVSPDKQFALCDGRLIKDPKQLAEILKTINDDVFNFHVNDQKNDFANWINDVFQENSLADEIRNIRNKIDLESTLYTHLFEKLKKVSKK